MVLIEFATVVLQVKLSLYLYSIYSLLRRTIQGKKTADCQLLKM
jgi:hypothetical protein